MAFSLVGFSSHKALTMLNIIISFLTFVLIILSLFMVLVILMQRANANSGMGSAFGGGAAESAFGAETTNILTRSTKWSALGFFVIALTLYLLYMYKTSPNRIQTEDSLPEIPVAEAAPATTSESPDPMAELMTEAREAVSQETETVTFPSEEPVPQP